jgi:hypothetical protein
MFILYLCLTFKQVCPGMSCIDMLVNCFGKLREYFLSLDAFCSYVVKGQREEYMDSLPELLKAHV